MSSPPPIPNLPPMQPMPSATSAAPAASQASPAPRQAVQPTGGRRLRQLVGYIGGASLGFVMLVCAGELALKPGIRPTDLLATVEARTDIGIFNQKMGVEPGKMVFTEADYRAKLAEAERNGQAKAELAFQKDLATVQADKERVVGAYQTLYSRAGMIAQAGLQMEGQAQQFRQQLVAMSNGGRSAVIGIKDVFCGFGMAEACDSARQDRHVMITESEAGTRTDLAAKINELMAGIEDPAAFTVRSDIARNGAPALSR